MKHDHMKACYLKHSKKMVLITDSFVSASVAQSRVRHLQIRRSI